MFLEPSRPHSVIFGMHSLWVIVDDLAVQFILVRNALIGLEVEVQYRHRKGQPGPWWRDNRPLVRAASNKRISDYIDPQALPAQLSEHPFCVCVHLLSGQLQTLAQVSDCRPQVTTLCLGRRLKRTEVEKPLCGMREWYSPCSSGINECWKSHFIVSQVLQNLRKSKK